MRLAVCFKAPVSAEVSIPTTTRMRVYDNFSEAQVAWHQHLAEHLYDEHAARRISCHRYRRKGRDRELYERGKADGPDCGGSGRFR